ncbi:MAG: PBSX family phage terminase large subunit [Spiribacter salinus]|uniref:PBSX family phage terminase large subunit n=1 Tax=Spiribacter salinus TaxID=1335746 RepID=A0A540V8G1_9GAMM|nr:MAG: PBSX family phage terminase large subunit [Spiribacter salinus]
MATAQIKLPPKLVPVFTNPARYRGAYGGRGSGKSFSFAKMLAVRGYAEPLRILCGREIQNSIKDSSQQEVIRAIESEPFLNAHYSYGESFIRGANGTEFLFKGLRHNYQQIKSTSGINICWVEEAEHVSEASWEVLIPTVREPGSEIWLTWNPESEDSATHRRFIKSPPSDSRIVKLNWRDNPWFPDELEYERQRDQERDPDRYQHIWEGETITRTEAQILGGKWAVREFEPDERKWDGPYYGLDFGFSNDPLAAVKCWVHDERLYIEHEAGKVNLELDDTPDYLRERVPGLVSDKVRADNARPECISHLKRHGMPGIQAAPKWQKSVEEGITFLRNFREIVIHPRCRQTQTECRLYSYKVDRLSGDVTSVIIDANNHFIDAIRYALSPIIKHNRKRAGVW